MEFGDLIRFLLIEVKTTSTLEDYMSVLSLLRYYCEKGFKIIPLKPNSKVPILKNWKEEATDDFDRVKELYLLFKDANWGLFLEKSKLVAIDTDLKHDGPKKFETILKSLSPIDTLITETGGGGNHFLFNTDEIAGSFKGKLDIGIDIKHDGYIVLPPSIHPNGKKYEWRDIKAKIQNLPEDLKKLILKSKNTEFIKDNKKCISLSTLKALVEEIKKHSYSYDEWLRIGAVIKYYLPNEDGFNLFSQATENESFVEGDLERAERMWNDFKEDHPNPARIGTLLHFLSSRGIEITKFKAMIDFDENDSLPEVYKNAKNAVIENNCLVFLDNDSLVEFINLLGFFYLKNNESASFGKFINNDDEYVFMLISESKLKDELAPIKLRITSKDGSIRLIDSHKVWINNLNRKTYKKVYFHPNKIEPDSLNLFIPLKLKPILGDCETFLNFILISLCNSNQEHFKYVICYLADIVQRPEKITSSILIFFGTEGTGKGLLFDNVMRRILDSYYLKLVDSKSITSRFNQQLARKLLVVIDEASAVQSKEALSTLKGLSGSSKISIEYKFGPSIELDSFNRYVICTNDPKAIGLNRGNRRFVIIRSSEKYANDKEFFKPLWEALDNGLAEIFLNYLLNVDLTNFDPNIIPNLTEDDFESQVIANGPVFEFWHDLLFINPKEFYDGELLSKNAIFSYYSEFSSHKRHEQISTQRFWTESERYIPILKVDKTPDRKIGGERSRGIGIVPSAIQDYFIKTYKVPNAESCDLPFMFTSKKSDFDDLLRG